MPKFRKKPVVIEAVQWTGENFLELNEWANQEVVRIERGGLRLEKLLVHTLEGVMTAAEGDWIIRGVKGELYPCKPDIFDATYEPECEGTPEMQAIARALREGTFPNRAE